MPDSPGFPSRVEEPDAALGAVPEAVLHDVWAARRYDAEKLATTNGARVHVLDPGRHNDDAGPDFLQARLRIEHGAETLEWTGDVEIHRASSEWLRHAHHADPRYNRVVLHVVLVADGQTDRLVREDGTPLPELVLHPALTDSLRRLLHRFYTQPQPDFPCAAQFERVDPDLRRAWVRRLGMERLRAKAARWGAAYGERPDLDALLYRAVLTALGFSKNAEAMDELARRVPLHRLRALDDPLDVEALLFGTAGLLPEAEAMVESDAASGATVANLRTRFADLGGGLAPMPATAWTFFRLRPANFPTRRLAQAAALLGPRGLLRHDPLGLLRRALADEEPARALRALFREAEPSPFWETHVRFERPTRRASARLGRNRGNRILIDAVLPLLLLDAEQREEPARQRRVERVLEQLPGDSDEVTRRFEPRGARLDDALDAQGLHQLYRTYCSAGRCLACDVGVALLDAARDG